MRSRALAVTLLAVVTACADQTATPSTRPSAGVPTGSTPTPSPAEGVDVIFTDGNIITMDDAAPHAQAIAIRGERIVAVGTNDEVGELAGPATQRINLEGRTVVPGFIDAHQHRIGDRAKLGMESPEPLIQAAIEQGWTTIHELYVDDGRLTELRDLDLAGRLRLRVNAYLPVNENSPEGRLLGDWYDAYQPGQMVSPRVRVAGLKVFTDFNNATILLWSQDDLNAFLLQEHQRGWQLAVKTVSTTSLEMIIQAFQAIEEVDPAGVDARGRLEHALFATPEQIAAIKQLGLVPIIQANNPGQLIGVPDIDALIEREPDGSYVPWRSMVEAGTTPAGGTGFPTGYVDEPTGAPFGSPMHPIYQAVTRAGTLRTLPDPSLLDQALTAEQTPRAYTISAAYAAFEEDVKGSLTAGKLADLVVLSADPLSVPTEEINEIDVLMTMIGGRIEYCGSASLTLCPDAEPLSGAGDVAEYTISGVVPDGAVAADVGYRINTECGCSGPARLDLYRVEYREGDGPARLVPNGDFAGGLDGWGAWGVADHRLVASDAGTGRALRVSAADGEDGGLNSALMPVTAGSLFTVTFTARVGPVTTGSGYFQVIFHGARGEVQRLTVPLEALPGPVP